jgi:hypothetical protein
MVSLEKMGSCFEVSSVFYFMLRLLFLVGVFCLRVVYTSNFSVLGILGDLFLANFVVE